MDDDLPEMSKDDLIAEVKKLRNGIIPEAETADS